MMKWRLMAGMLVVLVSVAWLGSKWVIGARVETQMALLAESLEASDDITLTRFEYRRGLFGGELDYAMVYSPLPATAAHAWLAIFDQRAELPLQGSMAVRHGPWLGGEGWALADMTGDLPLPEAWQQRLPAQSAAALARLQLLLAFDQSGRLQLRLSDYAGPLLSLNDTAEQHLSLRDVSATLNYRHNTESLDLLLEAGELALAAPAEHFSLTLQDWVILSNHQRLLPFVWRGTFSSRLASLALQTEAGQLAASDLLVVHDLGLDAGMLDHEVYMAFDELQLLDANVGEGQLMLSLKQLDAAAYADLMHWRQQLNVAGATAVGTTTGTALEAIIERLLAAQPAVAVDELSLSLADTHDTSASLRLQYSGPSRFTALDVFSLPSYLDAQASLLSTERALDALVDQMVARLSGTERELAREQLTRDLIATLGRLGFVGDGQGNIGARARLSQGQLMVNDQLMATSGDLFGWFLDLMLLGA